MMISYGRKVDEWQSKMLLNTIGRLLYWTAWALQLTSALYREKTKRYVQHRFLYYNIFVTFVKIALLAIDIPPVLLMWLTINLKVGDNFTRCVLLGQCVLWLGQLYTLMDLICLTHLSFYQRRMTAIFNKILNISRKLENSCLADSSESTRSCRLHILLFLGIIRLVVDLWNKLSIILYLTSYVYHNTLFSFWYLGLALYQTKLIIWRRKMVLFLNEFIENEGYRARVEVDRLIACLQVNYSIFKLQLSFYKIWNSFSCILPLLLLNFVNFNFSFALHCVSILIVCHITDEGRLLENQFLDLLFVASLRTRRGERMVHEAAINRHLESFLCKNHQQLSRRYAFSMTLKFVIFSTMYFMVLQADITIYD